MILSRRSAMSLIGGAGAFVAAPFKKAIAGLSASALPKQLSLYDQVKAQVEGLSQDDINAALRGTYWKIFKVRPSTLAVEQTVHARFGVISDLKNGAVSRVDWNEDYGQRFVYSASTYEIGFGFAVVPDGDPRGVSAEKATIASIPQMKQESRGGRPVRASEMPDALARLIATFRDFREADAAAVLSKATTYDATIAGDGVSLCSTNHPCDNSVWANTLPTPCHLTFEALRAACEGIGQFVDDQNLRIMVRPTQLIVGRDHAETAKRLTTARLDQNYAALPYLVWDQLQPDAWFVQTDVDGLVWFERNPFELDIWVDHETGAVWVYGYERRCFTYNDPRAVFGVVMPAFGSPTA